ncbi:hypothetical protein ALC57_14970 [Trachymyrmex cornetzi]|uniref:Uncharacterized protein n=1 Tax=Trachymyrmex cornetzi TaxID=471704 RepID=A0A195DJ46_9HYME|nr:hypothetical protein ALC57_14970 [Trachymyrmex cornetzi]
MKPRKAGSGPMELREKNSCGHFSKATIKTRVPASPPSSPLRPPSPVNNVTSRATLQSR